MQIEFFYLLFVRHLFGMYTSMGLPVAFSSSGMSSKSPGFVPSVPWSHELVLFDQRNASGAGFMLAELDCKAAAHSSRDFAWGTGMILIGVSASGTAGVEPNKAK